ncbi:TIR domain-containing protein [Vibrio rotiferianus]|uniref:CD-NTase-associated protein 12/Pycsar effector protein TIR domain-containing protein n=1 Tax=Vibrio sp. DAT722 TaxID=344879 RepID=Q2F9V3_9VIBR|nr:TIR domain-containing protein [Vibrio rotiferianus]ABA55918.1 hypothetical protein [Vibrio sp. DAT722]
MEKVFYSWQSDSPGNTNRNFISTALNSAVDDLKSDKDFSLEPVIDRDTLGVAGSPDISQSIFSKIDNASVFVCDVSIINQGQDKLSPNPNVLIELGYAIGKLGWERIIMIMNTEYGSPTELPFDLRSKRVTTYHVKATDEEKAPARKGLSKTLVAALKLCLLEQQSISATKAESQESKVETLHLDQNLMISLKEVLPANGSIAFIDEQNMAGFAFEKAKLNDLRNFVATWHDAEHEFVNEEIEALKSSLYRKVTQYMSLISTNTFSLRDPKYVSVPAEWEREDSVHFFNVVNELHEAASDIVQLHRELLRAARVTLGV